MNLEHLLFLYLKYHHILSVVVKATMLKNVKMRNNQQQAN